MDKWHERTSCLDPTELDGGKKRENRERKERGKEEEDFRERESTFSLNFPVIGPTVLGGARGRVYPRS